MWKGSWAGERPGQAGWHSYLPTGRGLSELLQLGQASVFTRQECGWLSVAPGNHTEGPGALHPDMSCGLPSAPRTRRASEYLASQRVEGEVRARQSTSLADRDPNPERQLVLGSTGDPWQVWDLNPGTPHVHPTLHTQLHTPPFLAGGPCGWAIGGGRGGYRFPAWLLNHLE